MVGAALVNFAEDCPKHILVQYLDGIMLKLEAILNAKFIEVSIHFHDFIKLNIPL